MNHESLFPVHFTQPGSNLNRLRKMALIHMSEWR
jgi:hypothetical protein